MGEHGCLGNPLIGNGLDVRAVSRMFGLCDRKIQIPLGMRPVFGRHVGRCMRIYCKKRGRSRSQPGGTQKVSWKVTM